MVGINYLTAKTIVFFHKNHYKSYQFDLNPLALPKGHELTLSHAQIKRIDPRMAVDRNRIKLVCSIGSVSSPNSPSPVLEG